ncbi:hypothetical protein [Burkholderia cepacia]|uniref:hypothetical protein n=1 Tax=Burkholderia cepacia TaxID=292 RepID=UPI000B1D3CF6|nr:hypothetical protein [Burkholderia cepacia]
MKPYINRFVTGTRGWYIAEAKLLSANVAHAVLQNATWRLLIGGASAQPSRNREPS